jgi:hypothetical protein
METVYSLKLLNEKVKQCKASMKISVKGIRLLVNTPGASYHKKTDRVWKINIMCVWALFTTLHKLIINQSG